MKFKLIDIPKIGSIVPKPSSSFFSLNVIIGIILGCLIAGAIIYSFWPKSKVDPKSGSEPLFDSEELKRMDKMMNPS